MAGRWWRAYDEAVDDPKLLLLPSDRHRWAWFCLMCLASVYGGVLPPIDVVALKLRTSKQKAAELITTLVVAGLLDKTETGFAPHNWDARQFKTDVTDPTNATRQKRYRQRHAVTENTVTQTVTAKPPETEYRDREQRTDIAEPDGSDAGASRDVRKDLFDKGLKTLAAITGKTPDSCRSLVGKWLKSVQDEAIHVLGAIEEAERNRVADPVAWINKSLQPRMQGNGKRTVQQAADDLVERVRSFDAPAPAQLRDGESTPHVRLLPAR